MEIESVTNIIKQVDKLTKEPEKYLTVQKDAVLPLRKLTKTLYDFNKYNKTESKNNLQRLDELVIDDLDEEQIWQQIELQNNYIFNEFVSNIAHFIAKKDKLVFDGEDNNDADETEYGDDVNESGFSDEDGNDEGSIKGSENDVGSDEEEEEEDDDIDDNEENNDNIDDDDDDDYSFNDSDRSSKKSKSKKSSIVDDKFFKLNEMEEFLVAQEKHGDGDEDDEEIDYFEDYSSDSNDKEGGPHYKDFFDDPDDGKSKKRKRGKYSDSAENFSSKKRVKFSLENQDDFGDDDDNEGDSDFDLNDDDDNNNSSKNDKSEGMSSFEARQERLKLRIKALEEEALKEKPWQLKGEVTATHRPQNSLLEEYVEFDAAVRPPPVMTEKSTFKLEDIIKQRIKDKAWDDVERKIKPVEDPKEYRKRLVLDQEKSKLSLAQIYEQEYLKQKEARTVSAEDKPEEVPDEHVEIDKMMNSLFSKLDALSNFHFTPKMVTTEVKIVSNLPAVSLEEVAPVATSDAALLAPEEIKSKPKGDLLGKSERSKTDKKRERRLKKKKQSIRQKAVQKKEAEKSKLNNNEKVKDVKKKKISMKVIKKLGRNVSQVTENGDGKVMRSSNAFFSKLQDEARSQIQKSLHSDKLGKNKKMDVKKFKL